MNPPPRVSVIIPVRNDAASLRLCLAALQRQDYPADDFEVLVVDNGSADDLPSLRRAYPAVRWLEEGGTGSYAARNRGLRHAAGEIIAFTDADCVPDPAWLREGVAALAAGNATIIGGEVPFLDPVGRELNAYEILETIMFVLGSVQRLIAERGFAITANLFAPRAVFARVGEFDPAFKSAGDREWVHRAVARGERLRYSAAAIVRHPRRSTRAAFYRKQRRLVGGHLTLLRREHPGLGAVLAYLRMVSPLDSRVYRVAFREPRARHFRLRFAATVLAVSVVTTGEKIRLLLGGSPARG
jgi:glycosyltransferase involved in cell wall biosynthesis